MQKIQKNIHDIVLNETKLQNTKIDKYLWSRSGTKIPKSTNICGAVQKELSLILDLAGRRVLITCRGSARILLKTTYSFMTQS